MAKNPTSTQNVWSTSQEMSLLAWLDHTIRHPEIDFEETIVGHLDGAFEWRKIQGKLERFWTAHARDAPPGVSRKQWKKDESIYLHGSACLVGLTDGDREGIATTSQLLEDDFIADRLPAPPQSQLRDPKTVHPGRPNTSFGQNPINRETSMKGTHGASKGSSKRATAKRKAELQEDELSWEPPISKSQKREAHSTPVTRRNTQHITASETGRKVVSTAREMIVIDETDAEDTISISSTFSLKREAMGQSVSKSELERIKYVFGKAIALKNSIELNGRKALPSPAWEPFDQDSEMRADSGRAQSSFPENLGVEYQSPGPELEISNTVEGKTSCSGCQMLRPTQQLNSFCRSCAFEMTEGQLRIPTLLLQIQLKDQKWMSAISDIGDLREQLAENAETLNTERETVLAKEKEISNLGIAARQRDSCRLWPIETVAKEHLAEVDKLNKLLDKRNYWTTFTDLDSRSRDRSAKKRVDAYFRDLFVYARDAPFRSAGDKLSNTLLFGQHLALETLVCKALNVTVGNLDRMPISFERFLRSDAKAILTALANAALRHWVFETDFPRFNDTSETLSNYRTSVFEHDGAVALRNLDLASFTASVNNQSFRTRTIPEKATELAIRLSQTLAPLFNNTTTKSLDRDWEGFATWGCENDIWVGRRRHFTEMFTLALTAKAELCRNIEDYELVSFSPGTQFDGRFMSTKVDVDATREKVVGFCVQPAVFGYARKELSRDSSMADALVPTKNFVRKTEKEWAAVRPVISAQVVLSEDLEDDELLQDLMIFRS